MTNSVSIVFVCAMTLLIAGCDANGDPEPQIGAADVAVMKWQGSWDSTSDYQLNDVVAFNERSYIAIQIPVASVEPSESIRWQLVDNGGPAGPQGVPGPVGDTGITGANGVAGTDGADGADGADGSQGARGATWQGDWVSGTSYSVDDIVGYNGSAHIAIQDTSGSEPPTDASFWDVLAQSKDVSTLAGGAQSGYNFVGFSSTLVAGDVGLQGMNSACQTDFGVNARQSSSLEIANTPLLVAQTGAAWVRAQSHPSSRIVDNTSGITQDLHNCGGWSTSSASESLVVIGSNHSFSTAQCDAPISVVNGHLN